MKPKIIKKISRFLLPLFYMLFIPLIAFTQKEFYIPNALLIPLHDQQQQLHTSIGFGGGYDINLSYALFNHFAIFGTGTLNKGTRKRTSFFGDRYNIVKDDYAFTYGLGYFKKQKGILNILETYAGYGKYKVNNYWYFPGDLELGATFSKAHYWNIFWQFNVGKKTEKYEFGVAGRLSYSKYKDMQFYDTQANVNYIKRSYVNLSSVNFDPAFGFGLELKKIFINAQAGLSIPLNKAKVTAVETDTFPDQTIILEGNTTEVLYAFIGRISLQYNFNFIHKVTK